MLLGSGGVSFAAAGATLREDAAKLAEGAPGLKPPRDGEKPPPEKPVPPDQATILREATWSDADEALGRALRDMGALDRSFQRQGIGTRVMQIVIEEAQRQSKAVTLGVVKINPARRLYERLGFRTTGEDEYKLYMRREADAMP